MDKEKLAIMQQSLLWERLYRESVCEYSDGQKPPQHFCSPYPYLDPDFDQALKKCPLAHSNVLEIGCGLGEQSIALARDASLNVYSLDVSQTAIKQAQDAVKKEIDKNRSNLNITFINDNILSLRLTRTFSAIFDRGCFTVIPSDMRKQYVQNVSKHIELEGFLFLKTNGSIRKHVVVNCFQGLFTLVDHKRTLYQSLDDRNLPAHFFVFKRTDVV